MAMIEVDLKDFVETEIRNQVKDIWEANDELSDKVNAIAEHLGVSFPYRKKFVLEPIKKSESVLTKAGE